ncbi:MAG: hypothetical protein SPJ39_09625 [Prevotella sp.]|nr:hypothetical protein [Prevotella sp.]
MLILFFYRSSCVAVPLPRKQEPEVAASLSLLRHGAYSFLFLIKLLSARPLAACLCKRLSAICFGQLAVAGACRHTVLPWQG